MLEWRVPVQVYFVSRGEKKNWKNSLTKREQKLDWLGEEKAKMKWMQALLMLCCLVTFLVAESIGEKEKELSEVQKLIEQQKKMAQEAATKQSSAEKSKQQTQKQLNTTQKKLSDLTKRQENLKQSIAQSQNQIHEAQNRLSKVQISSNQAILKLLLADQQEVKLNQKDEHQQYLSFYMNSLLKNQLHLNEEMLTIIKQNLAQETEFNQSQNLTQTEQQNLKKITTNLQKIDQEISSFARQKNEYQSRAKDLEKSALALQNLINQLRIDDRQSRLTYVFTEGLEPPITGPLITPFGPKKHERYNISTFSNGVEIAVPVNSSIKSISSGVVVFADLFVGSGKMLIIDHQNGFHSIYSFNNTLLVSKGEKVSKGQEIALSGMSGSATEPSLRFELRKNGVAVNPGDFIYMGY